MSTPPTVPPIAPIYTAGGLNRPQTHLGLIGFGSPGDISLPIPQLGTEQISEVWPSQEEPRTRSVDGFRLREDGELLFGSISVDASHALVDVARDVYRRAIELVRSAGYPHFLRMWNHVGAVNAVEEGRERYQSFCLGRHEAFAKAGYQLAADLPAASAVGMDGGGLATYFLASREPGAQVENPRQVAAYCYPRQYGPKSPSFSRATVYRGTVFVSGTASVVGHETVHADDVAAQLEETLRNIDVVLGRAFSGGSLSDIVALKTYVRHERDYPFIAERLATVIPSATQRIFLRSDICRADLLLEIEAIAQNRVPEMQCRSAADPPPPSAVAP